MAFNKRVSRERIESFLFVTRVLSGVESMHHRSIHVIADGKLIPAEEGMNLPDIAAARREAHRSVADLAREVIRTEAPTQVDYFGAQF